MTIFFEEKLGIKTIKTPGKIRDTSSLKIHASHIDHNECSLQKTTVDNIIHETVTMR